MSPEKNKFDIDIEITTINSTLDRILNHHVEFKDMFKSMASKMEGITTIISQEKLERTDAINEIKDQLHGRINTILFRILGGVGMFVLGIIMWLIQNKN